MHKDDAAILFGVLANGNRIKILKKLYTKGNMDLDTIQMMFDCDIKEDLKILMNNQFINYQNNQYEINKELVDQLMKFISTPCGCNK